MKNESYSKKDVAYLGIICFLSGFVLGLLTIPAKNVTIGCYNGRENINQK
ncbi:MAG: hypothetical protein Q4C49_05140 [Bacillota bacterium]|nr:hypothetical protein [Bacillota bacterium]